MNYILIDKQNTHNGENVIDLKFPVLSKFKSTTFQKNRWTTHASYKFKISVTGESDYEVIKSLFKYSIGRISPAPNGWYIHKEGDIHYSYKFDKCFIGSFDIIRMQELSKVGQNRIIQLEVGNLEIKDAPKDVARNLNLMELLS